MSATFSIPEKTDATIFRAYDIRGIVDETLYADDVYAIGRAFAIEALQQHQKQVVVGYDGRLSSPLFRLALCQGLMDSGCDVIDIGCVPTPLVYYATHLLAETGIMLTGSHNPANYNGLKMVLNQQSPTAEMLQAIYHRIDTGDLQQSNQPGEYSQQPLDEHYIEHIAQRLRPSRQLKVVVDCGNGAGSEIFPRLLQALGCEVIPLFCEIDGRFPNHHPDPSKPENLAILQQTVLAEQADVGLALDGDGDRLGLVTDKAEIIWPDRQLMLYSMDVLQRNPGAQIVFDVKCSRQLGVLIQQHGGQPVMWKTGHSLIKRKLRETNAALAGEMSGHIFFNDDWFGFDDGLYTAARLLNILADSSQTCSEIFAALPDSVNTPELSLAVTEKEKFELMQRLISQVEFEGAELISIDGLRVEFSDGWGLVRASNTTPNLVMRFEADDQVALSRIQDDFRQQLLKVKPDWQLPF